MAALGKRRRTLTLEERVKVVKLRDEGMEARSIANILDASKTAVHRILRNRAGILQRWKCLGAGAGRGVMEKLRQHPKLLNAKVWEWFQDASRSGVPVTASQIREKALSLSLEQGRLNFQASDGWLQHWLKRHNLTTDCLGKDNLEVGDQGKTVNVIQCDPSHQDGPLHPQSCRQPAEQSEEEYEVYVSDIKELKEEGRSSTDTDVLTAEKNMTCERLPFSLSLDSDSDVIDCWNSIGSSKGLLTDSDIARFLISFYMHNQTSEKANMKTSGSIHQEKPTSKHQGNIHQEKPTSTHPGMYRGVCHQCRGSLTLTLYCTSCRFIYAHSKVEKVTAPGSSWPQPGQPPPGHSVQPVILQSQPLCVQPVIPQSVPHSFLTYGDQPIISHSEPNGVQPVILQSQLCGLQPVILQSQPNGIQPGILQSPPYGVQPVILQSILSGNSQKYQIHSIPSEHISNMHSKTLMPSRPVVEPIELSSDADSEESDSGSAEVKSGNKRQLSTSQPEQIQLSSESETEMHHSLVCSGDGVNVELKSENSWQFLETQEQTQSQFESPAAPERKPEQGCQCNCDFAAVLPVKSTEIKTEIAGESASETHVATEKNLLTLSDC